MNKKLEIYGAGGLGREVKSMLPYVQDEYELIGFLDDGLKKGSAVDDVEVLGGLDWIINRQEIFLLIAVGKPNLKVAIAQQLQPYSDIKFPILIHTNAHLQDVKRISIGEGSIIGAGSVLTTGITLGKHVLINLNVTVGHDTVIGDFASIMPGVNLAGHVELGKEVLIGSGANVLNNMTVGHSSIIGAGAVVNRNIPAATVAAGVPARVIK